MPNVPSEAVGFIAIERETVSVEVTGDVPSADTTLQQTLARLAGGASSQARLTGRHLSRFGMRVAEQPLRRRQISRLRARTTPSLSATVVVEVDLSRLVDQLKAEAEALGKRIDAAMDVTRRAAAIDAVPRPKAR